MQVTPVLFVSNMSKNAILRYIHNGYASVYGGTAGLEPVSAEGLDTLVPDVTQTSQV